MKFERDYSLFIEDSYYFFVIKGLILTLREVLQWFQR